MTLLDEVADAKQRQGAENQNRDQNQIERLVIDDPDAEQQGRDDGANRKNDEAWRERKHQRFHGTPSGRLRRIVLYSLPANSDNLYTILAAEVTDMTMAGVRLPNHRAGDSIRHGRSPPFA